VDPVYELGRGRAWAARVRELASSLKAATPREFLAGLLDGLLLYPPMTKYYVDCKEASADSESPPEEFNRAIDCLLENGGFASNDEVLIVVLSGRSGNGYSLAISPPIPLESFAGIELRR
jgi:hypothetical protein